MNDNCGSAWQLLWLNLCFYTIKWLIPSNTWHTLNDNCTRSLLGTSETKTFLLVPVKDELESRGGLALLDDFLGHCSCCVWGVPSAGLPCCSAKGPVPQPPSAAAATSAALGWSFSSCPKARPVFPGRAQPCGRGTRQTGQDTSVRSGTVMTVESSESSMVSLYRFVRSEPSEGTVAAIICRLWDCLLEARCLTWE